MPVDLINPTTEEDWSALLEQSRAENRSSEGRSDLIAMLGDYRPIGEVLGREIPGLYVTEMSLFERLEMARAMQDIATPEDTIDQFRYMAEMLSYCIFRYRDGAMTRLSRDELLKKLKNTDEVQKLGAALMEWDEKGGGQQTGESPTT